MAYQQYQQPRRDYLSDPVAVLILQKLYTGLAFGTLTAILTAFMVQDPTLMVLIIIFAFIGEIIAIIGYFFAKKETTIEKLYYLFVGSSSALLGFTIKSIVAEGGADIVVGAVGLTALTVGFVYHRAQTKQPNLQELGSKLFPLSIAFIAIMILSWFYFFGELFMLLFSLFGVLLFSAYLYYDFSRVMQGYVNSPARSAWRLYWDILLIFRYMLYFLRGAARMFGSR